VNIPNATQMLDAEWDQIEGKGFFRFLKNGVFDEAGFKRVQGILSSIEVPSGETFDKRFIEVTWFIPTFMRWQQDAWRLDGKNTSQLDEAIAFVEQRLTTILGLP
jgi:hypothetical protein